MPLRARCRLLVPLLAMVGLALGSIGCDSQDDPFTQTGSVTLQIVDCGLTSQTSETEGFQIAHWSVSEATADIASLGNFSFIGRIPCSFRQVASFLGRQGCPGSTFALAPSCQGSALALADEGNPYTATVRVRLESMELVKASRPDLPPTGDYDEDGILNDTDNCVLVDNPGQENVNEDEDEVGDACSIIGGTGEPTVADQDLDAVHDGIDNCVWVANPANPSQADTNSNGIGDACELVVLVTIPAGGEIVFPSRIFTIQDGALTTLEVNIDSSTAVTCSPGCVLDLAKVTISP